MHKWGALSFCLDINGSKFQILLLGAGHSLGGALATLAAFDIQRCCPCLKAMDISCYTFGAPRVGNHAWAKLYDATVQDTWVMLNNQVRQNVLQLGFCAFCVTASVTERDGAFQTAQTCLFRLCAGCCEAWPMLKFSGVLPDDDCTSCVPRF